MLKILNAWFFTLRIEAILEEIKSKFQVSTLIQQFIREHGERALA